MVFIWHVFPVKTYLQSDHDWVTSFSSWNWIHSVSRRDHKPRSAIRWYQNPSKSIKFKFILNCINNKYNKFIMKSFLSPTPPPNSALPRLCHNRNFNWFSFIFVWTISKPLPSPIITGMQHHKTSSQIQKYSPHPRYYIRNNLQDFSPS